MSDDYGYLNARVRALKARLLAPADLRAALASTSLEELTAFLESTAYAGAVGEALAARKGVGGVEEGLRRDLQRTFDHLVHVAGGHPRELLTIALGRWEVYNLKTVLRGRHAGAAPETVMGSAIPFGRLDEVALQELCRQPDVRAAIALLEQWRIPWAGALREAWPAYHARGDFHVLEVALDRSFFTESLRRLDPGRSDDGAVAECLRREVDLILMGYALRAVHHGPAEAGPGEFFIPGGRTVTRPAFERLCAARSLAEFLEAAPPSSLTACLSLQLRRAPESRRLFTLDRALQTCFLGSMTRLVLRDPLSIAFAIGYLWRKTVEVTNLRLIARGTHAGVPREEIEALLFLAA